MDEAQLKTLKVAELKELLTKANLPTTGVKTELIARLLANQPTEPPTPAVPTPSEPAPATPAKTDDAPVAAAEAKAPETTQADIDAELQKRKDRAARFGITQGEDEQKQLERQKRFGNAVEADTTAKSLSKLDQPLAERRRKGKRGQQEGAEAAAPATAAALPTATAKPASVKQTQTEEEVEKKRKRAERFGLATDDHAKKQKV